MLLVCRIYGVALAVAVAAAFPVVVVVFGAGMRRGMYHEQQHQPDVSRV